MTRRWKIVVSAVAATGGMLFVAAIGLGLFIDRSLRTVNEDSAIACALEWGRLAPFPASATDLNITTEGGPFTRAFHVTFVAPPTEIDRWLLDSAGTRETTPTAEPPSVRHFDIKPGGGAQRAEVDIDDAQETVHIYVSWS